MSDTPKIQLRDVHKAFGKKVVLDGVDLDVGVGESVVIIGGSGTGKSVTLKSILGLLQPDTGSIKVDGEEVVGMGVAESDRTLLTVCEKGYGKRTPFGTGITSGGDEEESEGATSSSAQYRRQRRGDKSPRRGF